MQNMGLKKQALIYTQAGTRTEARWGTLNPFLNSPTLEGTVARASGPPSRWDPDPSHKGAGTKEPLCDLK